MISTGVLDRSKRQPAVKHMDECNAIPWSQQVEEDLCENSLNSTENKLDTKNRVCQPFVKIYPMRSEDIYSTEKISTSRCPKMENFNCSLEIYPEETHKSHSRDTSVNFAETHEKGHLPAKTSYISNESTKKKITWASIASQPAKPNKRNNLVLKKKGPGMPPPPMIPGKHVLSINPWDLATKPTCTESSVSSRSLIPTIENENPLKIDLLGKWKPKNKVQSSDTSRKQPNTYGNPVKNIKSSNSPVEIMIDHEQQHQNKKQINLSRIHRLKETFHSEPSAKSSVADYYTVKSECSQLNTSELSETVLKQLRGRNNYNPIEMDLQNAALTRYFVIKSYSEDDIHRSIKYEIWCSTDHGNKKLDEAFKERMQEGGNIMLFFSVNGSGHFCGMAQMMTAVDYKSTASVWSQDKWKGKFKVKWIYVKDVPNSQLRHIRLENNENKSVTNSRDTQEIPLNQGLQMLKILHSYKHLTSIFDDFYHYEKKQEESVLKKPIHFDNRMHSCPNSNVCHSDTKDVKNEWNSGQLKDKTKSDRSEYSNTPHNRRYGKPIEPKRNVDVRDKEEVSKNVPVKHSNLNIENCGNENSLTEITFHVNRFNFNDNSIVKKKHGYELNY
ncbi:YTH domain-containing family protein isoform X2 [Eupeodes corollae]|uniref:YTH domain-containing family protein isoform X2 n=1 Tax=Eupeodes corollae TaxID=290404 RepID=UPI0024911DB8|nr:YTH domain-containing family protein isoform X2 [Eupeodes corollae]